MNGYSANARNATEKGSSKWQSAPTVLGKAEHPTKPSVKPAKAKRSFAQTKRSRLNGIIAILVIALICFGIIAEILLLGSKQLPGRNHIRNIYILLIIAALGAMVIAGPITGSTCVLEYKAKEYLCNKMECTRVTIHQDQFVSDREQELLKDSLNLHTPSFYKGTAYFKNDDSTEVSVIYDRTSLTKHLGTGRSIPYYTITYRIYAIPGK